MYARDINELPESGIVIVFILPVFKNHLKLIRKKYNYTFHRKNGLASVYKTDWNGKRTKSGVLGRKRLRFSGYLDIKKEKR